MDEYLFAIDTLLVRLYRHVLHAIDVKAIALDDLDVPAVLIRCNHCLYLRWLDLQAECQPSHHHSALMSELCDGTTIWISHSCCDTHMYNENRTENPSDDAQTLFPSTLKMAALSRFPVPTRLSQSLVF